MILGIVQKIILSSKNIFKYLNLWFFKRWICVGVLWFQTARQGSHALLMSTMWNFFFYIQQFVKVESSDDLCWCQPCGAFSLIYDCLSRFPRSNDLQLMEIGRKIHTTQSTKWKPPEWKMPRLPAVLQVVIGEEKTGVTPWSSIRLHFIVLMHGRD